MEEVIRLVEVDKPDQRFRQLLDYLLEAGITSSEELLLCPENVLGVIGHMGLSRARILRNYSKRVVLPVLGLQGNYEEPEIGILQSTIKEANQFTREAEQNLGGTSGTEDESEECGDVADEYDSDSTCVGNGDTRENSPWPSVNYIPSWGSSLSC